MDQEAGAPFAFTAQLPSMLECSGEFGAELNSFIPFVYWLHQAGLMQARKLCTYQGMRAFYYFLDDDQIIEKTSARRFVFPQARPNWLPNRNDHASRRSPFEMFPDYRARFGADPRFTTDRPLLILHNKFSVEWGGAPVNYIPLDRLTRLLDSLRETFRIVYIRPGIVPPSGKYSVDHQPDLAFADREILNCFSDVLLFEDMAAAVAPGMDYNEVKLRLYAHSFFHLTVQGGNAHMASLFSGSLVSILHRQGQEIRHAYRDGHFGYAANPAPVYLICRTADELDAAAGLMQQGKVIHGRVMLPAEAEAPAASLSPAAQCGKAPMAAAAHQAA